MPPTRSLVLSSFQHVAGKAEGMRHRDAALQLLEALMVGGDGERAGAAEAGGAAGLRLEPGEELGAVLRESRHVVSRAQLADQPGGVPRRTAGELAPLEQDDIAPSHARQVIGGTAADDAAADDDDSCLAGNCVDHVVRLVGNARVLASRIGTVAQRPRESMNAEKNSERCEKISARWYNKALPGRCRPGLFDWGGSLCWMLVAFSVPRLSPLP
jgi:hypothetical protein